ncbi:MAG: NYN domain-containing protein [Anaerovoracaceae bacterium]|jgi:small GTP-binding protein
MEQTAFGILAHVDAGKTTLSEALLYHAGRLRRPGRVDHRDAFLDTDALERRRGITIFAKQAVFDCGGRRLTLVDTPGHVDFAPEMERTLPVLDCAVLVISAADGVQSHTRTLWQLLRQRQIPVFLFCNKMDLAERDRAALLAELNQSFGGGVVDFQSMDREKLAECDETLLEHFVREEPYRREEIAAAVRGCRIFPCCFGSALKLEGTEDLLRCLIDYAPALRPLPDFAAAVYKISHDERGARLTHLRVLGGSLRARTELAGEKVTGIRLYDGARWSPAEEAGAGTVCAVTGLSETFPGMGLGAAPDAPQPELAPILRYRVEAASSQDPHALLEKMRQLEEEDPTLRVTWQEAQQEIEVSLMGEVQLEILAELFAERWDEEIRFHRAGIVYRETIRRRVEGVGHFEPLRHYAEVHLVLEPGERGSGIVVDSRCSEDRLAANWQHLVLTDLAEREHRGVLTGAPLTDVHITLAAGRAHEKHTDSGDFREAARRAVRQGLMEAGCELLEPWYRLRIEVPPSQSGRVLADLQRLGGSAEAPRTEGGGVVIRGRAPVRTMREYPQQLRGFTRGEGQISLQFDGFDTCADAEKIIAAAAYDPLRDTENPSSSVFCRQGSGVIVPWDHVKEHMHEDSVLSRAVSANLNAIDPRELEEILAHEQGGQPRKKPGRAARVIRAGSAESAGGAGSRRPYRGRENPSLPEILLIDGYNLIFAWPEMKELSRRDVGAARDHLIERLGNYRGWCRRRMILVFDAYKVAGGVGSVEKIHGIDVVYTRHAETADMYIERVTHEMAGHYRVRVVTSDGLEQLIIWGHGAFRIPARDFIEEIHRAEEEIRRQL